MVFAANGAVVIGGHVLGSRFHAPQRRPEAATFGAWFKDAGCDVHEPESGSREVLRGLCPDAITATREDALVFGLNSVSDGRNVVVSPRATGLIAQLSDRGYVPVPIDLSELHKAGGGAKCCTQVRTNHHNRAVHHREPAPGPGYSEPLTYAMGTTVSSVANSLTGVSSLCNSRNPPIPQPWPRP
jgi:N-dimethylarginine dimethylaminohydrolase